MKLRSLYGPAFWRSYWIALRRSGRDKRARTLALRSTLAILYILYLVAYLSFLTFLPVSQGDFWQVAFYGFIFGTGALAAYLFRRSHRRQDELLNFSLTGGDARNSRGVEPVAQSIVKYLESRELITWALMVRAGSEIHEKDKKPPDGRVVFTRQALNIELRQRDVWSELEPSELELMAATDGTWTDSQQMEVVTWCEQLRLSRWTLGVDLEIAPLAHFPKVDYSLAPSSPTAEVSPRRTLRSWDVRIERDTALAYTLRAIAELKARGLTGDVGGLDDWTEQLRSDCLGASSDLVVGMSTIAELGAEPLRLLAKTAFERNRYASYLVELLSADGPFAFSGWSEMEPANTSPSDQSSEGTHRNSIG